MAKSFDIRQWRTVVAAQPVRPLTQAEIDRWPRPVTPENRFALRDRVRALVALIRRRRKDG